jgi:hypothetical protein
MRTCFYFLLLLICPLRINAQEESLYLHYLPGQTAIQNNAITVDFLENSQYKQAVESHFTFTSQQSDFPVFQGPMDAQYVFKKIKFEYLTPEENFSYDTENPALSHMDSELAAHCTQLNQLINRPLMLHFNNDLKLENKTDAYQDLLSELPLIQIFPQDFFNDSFSHAFALAGQELKVGKTYQKVMHFAESITPYTVNYTILKITDEEVSALIFGEVEFQETESDFLVEEDVGEQPLKVEFHFKGKITGKGIWNRQNALIYQIDTISNFKGGTTIQSQGKNEHQDVFFKINLVHHADSHVSQ